MSQACWGLSFFASGTAGLLTMYFGWPAQLIAMVGAFCATAYTITRAGL